MAEESTGYDVASGIGEAPWAVMAPLLGASVPIVGSAGGLFVKAGSSAMTVDVLSGISYAFGQRSYKDVTTNLTIPTVSLSGAVRWDAVVLRRDWSTNSNTIMRLAGTEAVAAPMVSPTLQNTPGDKVDELLALVKATQGSTALDIRDRRVWSSELITVGTSAALPTPTSVLFGLTAYVLDEKKYYRCLTVSGSSSWVPDSGSRQIATGSDLVSPQSGWALTSSSDAGAALLPSRGIYDPISGRVEIDLQMRRTGSSIGASSNGNCDDTPICSLVSPFICDVAVDPMPLELQYASGSESANSWRGGEAILSAAGVLTVIQLAPSIDLGPLLSGPSIRLHLTFTRLT